MVCGVIAGDGLVERELHLRPRARRLLTLVRWPPAGTRQFGDLPARVATSTPRLETTKGTRYVKADFSHTTMVASPRITTSSWLMRKSTVPTISAIEMVRTRCGGYRQTFGISRHVDQTGRDEEAVDLIWSSPAPKIGPWLQPPPEVAPGHNPCLCVAHKGMTGHSPPRCSRRRRTAAAIVTAQ
jgi:hypothetical protein